MLVFEDYYYVIHRRSLSKTSWKCSFFKSGCKMTVRSQGTTIVVTKEGHNHAPSDSRKEYISSISSQIVNVVRVRRGTRFIDCIDSNK